MSQEINSIPFLKRFYARLEAMALASVGSRVPQGSGEVLLVYDGTTPLLYVPNSTGTAWVTYGQTSSAITNTYARVRRAGGNQTLVTADGAVPIVWDTEDADTIGGFDLGISTDFTAPANGVYQATISVTASALATATANLWIEAPIATTVRKSWHSVGTSKVNMTAQIIVSLTTGQKIRPSISVNNSTTLTLAAADDQIMEVVRLS